MEGTTTEVHTVSGTAVFTGAVTKNYAKFDKQEPLVGTEYVPRAWYEAEGRPTRIRVTIEKA